MGIGSFFASLFQKEDDNRPKIREIDVKKEQKEGAFSENKSVHGEGSGSVKPEITGMTEEREAGSAEKEAGQCPKESTEAAGRKKTEAAGEAVASSEGAGKRTDENTDSQKDIAVSEEKAAKKEYFQAKKELYYHLNQTMKILYDADREDAWESIQSLEGPSKRAQDALERVNEELPEKLYRLLAPFTAEENLAQPTLLKPAFTAMMLPFYQAYKEEFAEFRYNTFLNRDALELLRRLTGRKYRLGYRNHYSTGIAAFEWEGDRYKIYNSEGTLLCDAVFEDGRIFNGYAVMVEEDPVSSLWDIRKKGHYENGNFTEEASEYVYKKPVDLL